MIIKRPWSQPQPVPDHEWPRFRRITDNLLLLNEIVLKLEQTPAKQAIAVNFDTPEQARRARKYLTVMAACHLGPKAVTFAIGLRSDGITPALFARRGLNWGKGNMDKKFTRQEDGTNGRGT